MMTFKFFFMFVVSLVIRSSEAGVYNDNHSDNNSDPDRIVFVETDMSQKTRDMVIHVFQLAVRSGLQGYQKVLFIVETLQQLDTGTSWNVFCALQEGLLFKHRSYVGYKAVIDHDGKYWVVFQR